MRVFLVFIPFILLVLYLFVQTAFPVFLLISLGLSFYLTPKWVPVACLICGTIQEIFTGQAFGVFSMFYLLLSLIILLYKRRFHADSFIYVIVFTLIASGFYSYIYYGYVSFFPLTMLLIIIGLFHYLIFYRSHITQRHKLRYP